MEIIYLIIIKYINNSNFITNNIQYANNFGALFNELHSEIISYSDKINKFNEKLKGVKIYTVEFLQNSLKNLLSNFI